jgi:hypothetical protein
VDLGRQIEQPLVAGAIVKPVDRFKIVAGAHRRPVAGHKILLGEFELPFEIAHHERNDARIGIALRFGVLVPGLKAIEHEHVRPEIRLAATAVLFFVD